MIFKLRIKKHLVPVFQVFFLVFLFSIISKAQEDGNTNEFCINPLIKTILLYHSGWELSMPVLIFNEEEALELRFDYLAEPESDFSYSISNCTYDWQLNDIPEHYYLEGFNDVPIYDYHPSRNTTKFFTHYFASIPNEDLKITQTGNYLLKVYESDDPEKIIFAKRFAIAKKHLEITAKVNRPDDEHQELMLQVDLGNLNLINPIDEVKIVIVKNYDWNNTVAISSPPLLRGNVLHLDMPYQIMAQGVNEYRYFDAKSTKFISEGIEYIDYEAPDFHFFLTPDELKQYIPYFYSKDFNGRSFIEIPGANDRHLESDYIKVHFTLESPQALGTDVYIYGALTNWKTDSSNYMVYNSERMAYEGQLQVKQGLLNYAYATRDYNSKDLNFDITEGNHDETENDYLIFVYLRKPMSDFDELVGYTIINSTGTIR